MQLAPPRLGVVAAFTPGEVVGEIFDMDLHPGAVSGEQVQGHAPLLPNHGGLVGVGGEYRARLFSSGWEGTGRVEACEPPQRLLVRITDADESDEQDIEVTLTADGDQTIVVWEERGMPLDLLSAYGAGVQLHVEDLADHLAGRERRDDTKARWDELHPAYQDLAANS